MPITKTKTKEVNVSIEFYLEKFSNQEIINELEDRIDRGAISEDLIIEKLNLGVDDFYSDDEETTIRDEFYDDVLQKLKEKYSVEDLEKLL